MVATPEHPPKVMRLPIPSDLSIAAYEEAASLIDYSSIHMCSLLCSRQQYDVVQAICDHLTKEHKPNPFIIWVPDAILASPNCWALGGMNVVVVEDKL